MVNIQAGKLYSLKVSNNLIFLGIVFSILEDKVVILTTEGLCETLSLSEIILFNEVTNVDLYQEQALNLCYEAYSRAKFHPGTLIATSWFDTIYRYLSSDVVDYLNNDGIRYSAQFVDDGRGSSLIDNFYFIAPRLITSENVNKPFNFAFELKVDSNFYTSFHQPNLIEGHVVDYSFAIHPNFAMKPTFYSAILLSVFINDIFIKEGK